MFIIRKQDFALLYRTAMNRGSSLDIKKANEFRTRNPDCPHIMRAETFDRAVIENRQLFEII